MKMKNSVISALLALGMTACVESTPILQIGRASAQAANCSVGGGAGEVGLLAGSLDLGIRPGGGYPLVLAVNSNVEGTAIEVGDQPLTGDEALNTLYITELVLDYSSSTAGLAIGGAGGTVPLYGTLSRQSNLLVNLFTSEAAEVLAGFVTPGVSADVLVSVQLRGKRASGDEVESNEIAFPVTVTNFGFACPPGQVVAPLDDECPQAGLNGVVPECEDAPAP